MEESYLLQILSMFFFSVWKTYIGPLIAVVGKFSYLEMLLFNLVPGLLSAATALFTVDLWHTKRRAPIKGFDKNLRKVLRMWRRFGKGLTLVLAPVLIGIPSYALIARRLKEPRTAILLELCAAMFFWCSVIYFAGQEGLILAEKWI